MSYKQIQDSFAIILVMFTSNCIQSQMNIEGSVSWARI